MVYQGIYGISKTYKKDAILIYHGYRRAFMFQIRKFNNTAVCIQCQHYHTQHDKSFHVKTFNLVNGNEFLKNPADEKYHRCPHLTKGMIDAEQIYRGVLCEINGTQCDTVTAYELLVTRFKEAYGGRYQYAMDKLQTDIKNLKTTLRRRAMNGHEDEARAARRRAAKKRAAKNIVKKPYNLRNLKRCKRMLWKS